MQAIAPALEITRLLNLQGVVHDVLRARAGVLLAQGLSALPGWALLPEQSVLIGGLAWPPELAAVPVRALGVALATALLPAWEACRIRVFELLQSR